MKLIFSSLAIILLISMNISALAKKCPVNPHPDPDDKVLIPEDITQMVNYQGDGDPPVGKSVPLGFGKIIPTKYKNGNDSSVATLLVCAQFVADHAVVKGLFTNSNHKISQVFSRQVTHIVNIVNWGGKPTDLGNDKYTYDIEIISSENEKIRAQCSVQSSVFDNIDSFWVDSFSFAYNAIVSDEAEVIELNWWRNDETENYKYSLAVGGSAPQTKVIDEDNLPAFGTTITNDQFLAQKGWTKVALATINSNVDLKYIFQMSPYYVGYQLQKLPIFSAVGGIDHDIGLYQQNVDANTVKYRFNVEAGEPLTETANINFEFLYDKAKNSFYVYTWSAMNHVIPLIF